MFGSLGLHRRMGLGLFRPDPTQYGDTVTLAFGDASDIAMQWTGSYFAVTQATADSAIKLGTSGAGIDLQLYGDTAGRDLLWDQSADSLIFGDSAKLVFGAGSDVTITPGGTDVAISGSGALNTVDSFVLAFGTGKDIGITWDSAKLVVSQAAPNSAIHFGLDGAGIDINLFGDTASAAVTWDQSADALVFSGVAKLKLQTIADPGTGVAIPVTNSGSVAITTAGAETNSLADPTFMGQTLSLFADTYAVGDRVVTAASRINQAGNTIMTFGAVGDFIKLEAITIGGSLKWQVVSNDGVALS